MKTLALWIIAICMVAQTLSVYTTDYGETGWFFGNFGYYQEGDI
jgi:hypothetical protein